MTVALRVFNGAVVSITRVVLLLYTWEIALYLDRLIYLYRQQCNTREIYVTVGLYNTDTFRLLIELYP